MELEPPDVVRLPCGGWNWLERLAHVEIEEKLGRETSVHHHGGRDQYFESARFSAGNLEIENASVGELDAGRADDETKLIQGSVRNVGIDDLFGHAVLKVE